MRRFRLVALIALAGTLAAQSTDPVLRSMREEIERSRNLRIVGAPPYYIEYALDDVDSAGASATLGALLQSRHTRIRIPRVQVRVGDYKFDSTNYIFTDRLGGPRLDGGQFPLEDNPFSLRVHWWLATDRAYKGALESLARKQAALKNMTQAEDLPDFSPNPPVKQVLPATRTPANEARLVQIVRALSAVFTEFPAVIQSGVDGECVKDIVYFANSEGSELRYPDNLTYVRIRAAALAGDGSLVRDAVAFHSTEEKQFPSDVELLRGARAVGENLTALAAAPRGDAYTGPVLLEGTAAAQLIAEVLGRNFAVPRRPVSEPGRPLPMATSEFEGRIGARILPEFIDIVDDPTQREWRGRPLFGAFLFDLEGVAPKPVQLVEKGILKNYLLSRQPVRGFSGTNGRGRIPGSFGAKAATISNLFVRAAQSQPLAELRKKLIELSVQRGKPYGLLIRAMDFPSSASIDELRRIAVGMAQSGSTTLPVSIPLRVYRVYPDGREELIRGLRFRAMSTRSFRDVLAASEETVVFDYLENLAPFALMGAGSVVANASVIAPSLLFDELELDRVQEETPKPPVVPPPPLVSRTGGAAPTQ